MNDFDLTSNNNHTNLLGDLFVFIFCLVRGWQGCSCCIAILVHGYRTRNNVESSSDLTPRLRLAKTLLVLIVTSKPTPTPRWRQTDALAVT